MKIIKSNYPNSIESDIRHILSSRRIAFLDIETDGLSHKNKIILIGLILFTDLTPNGLVIQLFNDDYQSEKQLLLELWKILNEHDIESYISFNGDSFDFPFINSRYEVLKLDRTLDKRFNIDLLRIVRKNKASFPIPSFNLKSIENHLNINRADTINGKDSIILYHNYITDKDPKLEQIILLHNYDDIVNMIPLMKVFKTIPFPDSSYKINLKTQVLYCIDLKFEKDYLKFTLSH